MSRISDTASTPNKLGTLTSKLRLNASENMDLNSIDILVELTKILNEISKIWKSNPAFTDHIDDRNIGIIENLLGDLKLNKPKNRDNYNKFSSLIFLSNVLIFDNLKLSELLQDNLRTRLRRAGVASEVAKSFVEKATSLVPLPTELGESSEEDKEIFALNASEYIARVIEMFVEASNGVQGYVSAKSRFPSAEAYLKEVYSGRLGLEGDLDQSTLRKIDGPLMDALNLEFRGERRAELRALLPTKSERLDQKLEAELGYVPQGEERRRALTSLSRGHRIGIRRTPR